MHPVVRLIAEVRADEGGTPDASKIQQFLGSSVVRYPVYHGTNSKVFDRFEKRAGTRMVMFSMFDVQAQGFFFSKSREDAEGFGSRVITAYIRLENPLLGPKVEPHLGLYKTRHLAYMLRTMMPGPPSQREGIDLMVNRVKVPSNFAKNKDYDWVSKFYTSEGILWDVLDHPGVVSNMKRLGYDGTFVAEPDTSTGQSIFVIDPDQVLIVAQK